MQSYSTMGFRGKMETLWYTGTKNVVEEFPQMPLGGVAPTCKDSRILCLVNYFKIK